jgi:hypothetical protein
MLLSLSSPPLVQLLNKIKKHVFSLYINFVVVLGKYCLVMYITWSTAHII